MGFLFFANLEVNMPSETMGLGGGGLKILLCGYHDVAEASGNETGLKVSIRVFPGCLLLFAHVVGVEAWDQGPAGRGFDDSWEQLRIRGSDFKQIVKWKGEVALVSIVEKDGEEEQRAVSEGWLILEK